MKKTLWKQNKKYHWILLLVFLIVGCSGTDPTATDTPEALFVPPTSGSSSLSLNQTKSPPPTQQTNCRNQLRFEEDLTIPDGTEVLPREKISKRWLISNDGTCNWDQSYSFQLISGLALGADKVQLLYPARQGTQAVIEIVFTAPKNPGRYNSWWQAFDSQGKRFGDPVYMDISVLSE